MRRSRRRSRRSSSGRSTFAPSRSTWTACAGSCRPNATRSSAAGACSPRNCRLVRDLEFCGMIGRSAVMEEVFGLIRHTAPHARSALLTGETGTGKELVAHALHMLGPRRAGPFLTINCSAVVETLFESELFGHRRGAFTGAVDNKVGLFERANGGTLFLDEMGELPMSMQAKLLRVLETGEVPRVGDVTTHRVDVRVIAATNRRLRDEVAAGRFRSDLFYRLNLIEIELPPQRDRREDIPLLAATFVQQSAERLGKRVVGTTSGAERLLVAAPWDGNVRELRNVIERACILADTEFLTEREIQSGLPHASSLGATAAVPPQAGGPAAPAANESSDSLVAFERAHVQRVLDEVKGNKSAAASRLGLSRRALYRRLGRLGLG
ncbi:MAG: sigma-54-dependent Fis family transcriptional regulator [Acidobacteria bacterium]|nr:sigma-54-dependent Fis family transcriptional regulator [Acidobacteriota bacterium]